MPGCSARFCQNRRDQGFLMHVFPRDSKRRAEWADKVKRDNWQPTNYCYLCEAHFEDSQFELHRQDGKVKLKPYAVPTIFHYTEKKPMKTPRFLTESRVLEDMESITLIKLEEEPCNMLRTNACNAKNCMNGDQPAKLFPFPEDEDRCQEWVERSENETLVDVPASELCLKARLCAEHFDESQFVDSGKETLLPDALPSIFAHSLSPPVLMETDSSAVPSSSQSTSIPIVFKVVNNMPPWNTSVAPGSEKTAASLTYQQLCEGASQVKLPSSLWAVHKGLLNESVAFVHTNISDHFIDVDKAVIFQETCQASIYFQGQRVMVGMDKVKSLAEIETILNKINKLPTQPPSNLLSKDEA